jgi:hypothetical protein
MGLLLGICTLGMVLCGIGSYFNILFLIPTFVFVGVGLLAGYRLIQTSS